MRTPIGMRKMRLTKAAQQHLQEMLRKPATKGLEPKAMPEISPQELLEALKTKKFSQDA